jgi:hypothetical protein
MSATKILRAFKILHNTFVRTGLQAQLQLLDEYCSTILKDSLVEQRINFQLVSPGIYQEKSVERAILTFKKHFLARLCITDPNLPIHLWDCILPQAILALNLMRGSHIIHAFQRKSKCLDNTSTTPGPSLHQDQFSPSH